MHNLVQQLHFGGYGIVMMPDFLFSVTCPITVSAAVKVSTCSS